MITSIMGSSLMYIHYIRPFGPQTRALGYVWPQTYRIHETPTKQRDFLEYLGLEVGRGVFDWDLEKCSLDVLGNSQTKIRVKIFDATRPHSFNGSSSRKHQVLSERADEHQWGTSDPPFCCD